MMKTQLSTLTLILFTLIYLNPFQTNATHYMGMSMSYECLSSCTYRIYHDTYYDCSGAATTPLPGPAFPPNINFTPTSCSQPMLINNWQLISYLEITPICPTIQTQCTSPTGVLPGVLEARFYRDYDFCNVNCSTYNITWTTCCRNGTITSGAANNGIGSSTMLIDLSQTPCNNSPRFTSSPAPYICVNTPVTISQGAYDPDGDSLVFALGPCSTNANGGPVTYAAGYSPTAPLGPSWNVSMDPISGDLTFIPSPGNIVIGVICIYVNEYRNGVLIGQISRDIQVTVINCGTAAATPVIDSIHSVVNGTQTGPCSFQACPGGPMGFTIDVSDPDLGDSIDVSSTIQAAFPGATVSTTGTNPIQTTVLLSSATVGNYGFSMTFFDGNCPLPNQVTKSFTVSVGGACITGQVTHTTCQSANGAIDITVTGGQGPFTYSWSNGATTEDITGLTTGPYTVTVTDINGFTYSNTFWVNGTNITIATTVNQPDCNGVPGDITATVTGGTAPLSYLWNTGATTSSLSGLAPGGYSLTITDATGCTSHTALILDAPDSCYNIVEGYVYDDLNQNCVKDANESGLAYVFVDVTPGGAVLTDQNGYYKFRVNTGQYVVEITPGNYRTPTCPAFGKDSVTFVGLKQTSVIDFALDVSTVTDLTVNMTSTAARQGRSRITWIRAKNVGSVTMAGSLSFTHDPTFAYSNAFPTPGNYNAATATATWNFASLPPGWTYSATVLTNVDTTAVIGSSWTESAQVLPIVGDSTPMNNSTVYTDTIRAAFDPNDKQVSPQGIRAPGYILPSEDLMKYTVRFQNTGNDTAFYVVIRDTIDQDLEVSSYVPATESHPYSLFVEADSIFVFTFANILLPDSSTNYLGSQGHVSFYLRHNGTLSPGTIIENTAAIYFDFNAPVITNTVVNTVYTQPVVTIGNDTTICEGQDLVGNVTAAGMPPYDFTWSTGDTDPGNFAGVSQTPVITSGTYSVSITDAFGFTSSDMVNVTAAPLPDAVFTINLSNLTVALINTATVNTSWAWDFGDGNTATGSSGVAHTYTSKGLYTVTLIATNDCGSDTTTQVVDFTTGFDKNEVNTSVTIQPNPFSSSTFVRFDNPTRSEISIYLYDLQGRQVREYGTVGEQVEVRRENLAKGIYLLEVRGEGVYYGRVVVE